MDAFLKDGHPLLGSLPGPLALAGRDGVIWAAGGGRGESALSRFDAEGWRRWPVDANGLRAVYPLDDGTVVLAGEHGYLAIADGARIRRVATPCEGCLYALTGVGELIWVTGDDGFVATLDPRTSELRIHARFTSDSVVGVAAAPGGELVFVTGSRLLRRASDGAVNALFSGRAPLTDAAFAPDGRLAVAGDAGQLYLAAPGRSPEPCDAPALDLERLSYDARRDAFLVTGEGGFVGVLGRDGILNTLPAAVPAYRLTGILPWRDGHLYAGWIQQVRRTGCAAHCTSTAPAKRRRARCTGRRARISVRRECAPWVAGSVPRSPSMRGNPSRSTKPSGGCPRSPGRIAPWTPSGSTTAMSVSPTPRRCSMTPRSRAMRSRSAVT
ncbi:hypothetical protein AB0F65_21570 [Nocardia rhamnosiphila]|uniref:hypothetical protein n=1 Tax=Nocardia rhamnosiphila TaxID=426716 RepID=UPI0033CC4900